MKSKLRDPNLRYNLAALAAGCWSLAVGSLGATQVLTLPVVSSSTMGVKLSVDPGSGLGTASDTKTPNVQGTVLVQLDDNGAPAQIALRDFTLQPQNNNPLDFNLAWSKPIIGVVALTHGGMVSITPDTPAAGIDEVSVTVPKSGNPTLFGRLKVSR